MANIGKIIFVCLTLLLIGAAAYFIKFHSGFSNDPQHWGQFSDYFNLFVGISNLVVVFWFSIAVYKYNEVRDKENKIRDERNDEFQKSIERPIVIFRSNHNTLKLECWEIVNVGNGAALNIRLAELQTNKQAWETPIKLYSLAKDGKQLLPWTNNSRILVAHYTDVSSRDGYFTITAGDESQVVSAENLDAKLQMGDIVFDLPLLHSITRGEGERLINALNQYAQAEAAIKDLL
jgi:hypothetical protein